MWCRNPLRQVLVAAVLVHTLGSCTVEQSWSEPPTDLDEVKSGATRSQELEEGVSKQPSLALSCEDIRPAELGPSTAFITRANGPEADCGPGSGTGDGALALLNSGPFGAVAWTVVSAKARPSGNRILGGDFGSQLVPLRQGFHLLRFSFPSTTTLTAYTSTGEFLRSNTVSSESQSVGIAADPQSGTVIAWWAPGEGNTQVLRIQVFDEQGNPHSAPHIVRTESTSESPFIAVGVDRQGRILVLWRTVGSSTWTGQWLRRNGTTRTQPFPALEDPAPSNFSEARLQPLSGGGLALRLNSQWVRQFPSGQPTALPAPGWLADNPGTDLALIRLHQAYVLVLPPTPVTGSGCQESLRFFTSDGVACGELTLPIGGSTCQGRRLGIGWDGTVIQQVELNIPANDQCAWRWWPRLLR